MGGAVAHCLPSLVREGGPRQRWMSSLFIKVTFSWDYSSVSLTAATFPHKGRLGFAAFRSFTHQISFSVIICSGGTSPSPTARHFIYGNLLDG